jgi:glycosyltransferase involved in cell wall biosynthesis
VKIALVTTPWSSRSGIADYTRHLLPYLRESAEVDLFVEVGRELEDCGDESPQAISELVPRDFDQILYQLGNEAQHAFMIPIIKSLGGTVVLHDWVLFDLAVSAYPALATGGLSGLRRAYAEGGVGQALHWRKSRTAAGATARGWFDLEDGGRWSAPIATIPTRGAEAVRLQLHVPQGRTWRIQSGRERLAAGQDAGDVELEFDVPAIEVADLEVSGAGAMGDDKRPLGVFIKSVEERRGGEWTSVPLCNLPSVGEYGLATARFDLPLNHSVVRHADAFLVHSDSVGKQILESRNAVTPVFRVHHGVEKRWNEVPRESARRELGLDAAWESSFLIASFGALQSHKRPDVLLAALQLVRERGLDVRLLCVGEERPAEFDVRSTLRTHGLEDDVRITGWLPEEEAWGALRAADLCINLRGPSTGGTSGGACQALSVGRPVIVSDLPELCHLPDACVKRVAADENEARSLADTIAELCNDRAQLAEMERAARKAVEDELHWSHVAKRFTDLLKTYPRARASRRSLLVRFVHATAKGRDPSE